MDENGEIDHEASENLGFAVVSSLSPVKMELAPQRNIIACACGAARCQAVSYNWGHLGPMIDGYRWLFIIVYNLSSVIITVSPSLLM